MKETKEIIDEVQAIRKDKKAIEILGAWYQSFKPLNESIQKGDQVKILYTQNKGFNNIVSIEKIVAENLKSKENHVVQDNRKDQIASQLSAYVKDIAVAVIQSSQSHDDLKTVMDLASSNIINTYNKIKQSI